MNTLIPGAPLRSLSPTANEYQRAQGESRAAKPARAARFTLDAPEHSGTIPGARGDILTPGVALTSNLAVIFTLNHAQPGSFQSPGLNRPVDRQAYQSCRPSSSRLPPRQTRPSNRLGGAALRCIPPSCERGTSSASRACTGCAWDTSWSNIPRPPPSAHLLSARAVQQRRCAPQKVNCGSTRRREMARCEDGCLHHQASRGASQ